MPRRISVDGQPTQVATEQELLDFANAIRTAGGAGVIEALMTDRYEFAYLESDIPEGMTCAAWRHGRHTPRRSTWSRIKAWRFGR